MPHSVISAATSQDRCVNAGDRRQYNHASMTKPETPADVRHARILKPQAEHPHEGQGSQDGAKADERRHETGHDRDRARRAIARSKPPKIRA